MPPGLGQRPRAAKRLALAPVRGLRSQAVDAEDQSPEQLVIRAWMPVELRAGLTLEQLPGGLVRVGAMPLKVHDQRVAEDPSHLRGAMRFRSSQADAEETQFIA